jgi:hypothetical protein
MGIIGMRVTKYGSGAAGCSGMSARMLGSGIEVGIDDAKRFSGGSALDGMAFNPSSVGPGIGSCGLDTGWGPSLCGGASSSGTARVIKADNLSGSVG